MDWLTGLALLPALICGGMCLGGMAVAALGLRRTTNDRTNNATPTGTRAPDETAAEADPLSSVGRAVVDGDSCEHP